MRPRPTLLVADPPFERRVLGRQGVEHRSNGGNSVCAATNSDVDDGGASNKVTELRWDADANVHGDQLTIGAARTDITGGRCSARSRHDSPSSIDAYSSPERVPM